jgi:hypothetical protein
MITAIIAAAAVAIAGVAAFAYAPATRDDGAQARLLAASLSNRIEDATRVMELTAMRPKVGSTDALAQMGIPEDADPAKRQVARDVIAQYGFASIFLLTPDGDVYLGEPYEQQEQLPRLNYSDRDWYQGVSSTNDAYVSSVFMSATIHVPAGAIAVPVHADDAQQVAGYWVAIINLDSIEEELRDLGGSRIILVDHNGIEVADSARDPSEERTELRSFSDLQSVKQALAGKTGSLVETLDGQKVFVAYSPVRAPGTTWTILSVQPYDMLFKPVDDLRAALYAAIAIALGVGAGLGAAIAKTRKA